MNHSPEHMTMMKTEAARKRLANKAEREASKTTLEGGALVYKDSPPGVGWVLKLPSGHKKYLSSFELASDMWINVYRFRAESYTPKVEEKIKEAIREVIKSPEVA